VALVPKVRRALAAAVLLLFVGPVAGTVALPGDLFRRTRSW
jgi:hypothetical protein